MNRFILNVDPVQAAIQHNDKHVVKMILEEAQMLSTAHHVLNENLSEQMASAIYRPTHKNHPCSLWIRKSRSNYEWGYRLYKSLCEEYTFRYGKIHKSWDLSPVLQNPPMAIPDIGLTDFPQAMPEYCKRDSAVDAYQVYYIMEKSDIAKWTKRDKPEWWDYQHSLMKTLTEG